MIDVAGFFLAGVGGLLVQAAVFASWPYALGLLGVATVAYLYGDSP